jgi:hypothetical protein
MEQEAGVCCPQHELHGLGVQLYNDKMNGKISNYLGKVKNGRRTFVKFGFEALVKIGGSTF